MTSDVKIVFAPDDIVAARRKYFGGDSSITDIQVLNALYTAQGRGVVVDRLTPRLFECGCNVYLSNAADVKNIVAEFLKRNGFDGLWNDECACEIDDLFPCAGHLSSRCRPGYRRETPDDPDGFDFRIGPVRYPADRNDEDQE